MYGYKVCSIFAVWISEYAVEVGVEEGGASVVGSEEEAPLVIVVGVEVVPYDRWTVQYRGHFFYG